MKIFQKVTATLMAMTLAVGLTACSGGKLATVNGEEIKKDEFEKQLKLGAFTINTTYGEEAWDNDFGQGEKLRDKFNQLTIDSMINTRALLQEAKKQKVEVKDADVDKQYKEFMESLKKDKKVKEEYDQLKLDEKFVKGEIKNNMVANKLREKIEKDIKVSDQDVKDFYNKHKKEYDKDVLDAAHILFLTTDEKGKKLPDDKKKEVKKKAEEVLKKAKDGEDFAKLAKEYSQDPGSKDKGGELGEFEKGQMVPEFEKAAMALKPGEISDIVESQFGYHIIKLNKKEHKVISLDEAKESIIEAVKQQKFKEKMDKIKNDAKVEKNEDAINKVKVKLPEPKKDGDKNKNNAQKQEEDKK